VSNIEGKRKSKLPAQQARRKAFELFLLNRSYAETAQELNIPKVDVVRWAYEDNWGAAVKKESELVQAVAIESVAQYKVELAQSMIQLLGNLILCYGEQIEPESLTELMESIKKGAEIVNSLIGLKFDESPGLATAQTAIFNLVGESEQLFQKAVRQVVQDETHPESL